MLFALLIGPVILLFTVSNPAFADVFTPLILVVIPLLIPSNTLTTIVNASLIGDMIYVFTSANPFNTIVAIVSITPLILVLISFHTCITVSLQFTHMNWNGNVIIWNAADIISPIPVIFSMTPLINVSMPQICIKVPKKPTSPEANPSSAPVISPHNPLNTSTMPVPNNFRPAFARFISPVNTPTIISPSPDSISIIPPTAPINGSIMFKTAPKPAASSPIAGTKTAAKIAPIALNRFSSPDSLSLSPDIALFIPLSFSSILISFRNPVIELFAVSIIPVMKSLNDSLLFHKRTIPATTPAIAAVTNRIGPRATPPAPAIATPAPSAAVPASAAATAVPAKSPLIFAPSPITKDIPIDTFPMPISNGDNTATIPMMPSIILCCPPSRSSIFCANPVIFCVPSAIIGRKIFPRVIPASYRLFFMIDSFDAVVSYRLFASLVNAVFSSQAFFPVSIADVNTSLAFADLSNASRILVSVMPISFKTLIAESLSPPHFERPSMNASSAPVASSLNLLENSLVLIPATSAQSFNESLLVSTASCISINALLNAVPPACASIPTELNAVASARMSDSDIPTCVPADARLVAMFIMSASVVA